MSIDGSIVCAQLSRDDQDAEKGLEKEGRSSHAYKIPLYDTFSSEIGT